MDGSEISLLAVARGDAVSQRMLGRTHTGDVTLRKPIKADGGWALLLGIRLHADTPAEHRRHNGVARHADAAFQSFRVQRPSILSVRRAHVA
jgi:hypothetical protein